MSGSPTTDHAREHPGEAVQTAERMVLRYERGYTSMNEHLLELRSEFSYFDDRVEQAYWMSRSEFLIGSLRRAIDDRKTAVTHFEKAVYFAGDAIRRQRFSDAYRCLADALGQLLTLRGLVYQISHGLQARDAVLRALELDWTNRRAHISAGAWYLNAPVVAGGDVDYATEILAQVVADPQASDIERFLADGFLALAYEEVNERARAREAYGRALEMFPRNPWLSYIASELEIST
ncbi:MAG: hypothetical protein ACLFM0_07805 [Spirochaetales bacterium]